MFEEEFRVLGEVVLLDLKPGAAENVPHRLEIDAIDVARLSMSIQ